MAKLPNSILYQSADGTVTLIDIPTSVAAAQGTRECPNEKTLLSSEPQEQPFVTNEPKSEKARQKLQAKTVDAELHEEYRTLIEAGLDDIRAHHTGRWCLPRTVLPGTKQTRVRKRKLDSDFDSRSMEDEKQPSSFFPFDAQQEWHISTSPSHNDCSTSANSPRENASATTSQTTSTRPWNNSHHNPHPHSTTFTLSAAHSPSPCTTYTFTTPPHSSFHLSPLPHPPSPQPLFSPSHPHPTFPTILLDPPYPNRSARRAAPYTTLPTLPSLTTLLTALALPSLLQQRGGHIAIWTTNRPAFRDLLLAPTTGLFARWGVRLVEEWVWVKVTAAGEPVTPLGGLWRKPYEVLLVGRADVRGGGEEGGDAESSLPVRRRVLAAVPDLHSRKPCLKELFERFLGGAGGQGDGEGNGEQEGQGRGQTVLEIFARHLVTGWCSLGDEVVKFNQNAWWT